MQNVLHRNVYLHRKYSSIILVNPNQSLRSAKFIFGVKISLDAIYIINRGLAHSLRSYRHSPVFHKADVDNKNLTCFCIFIAVIVAANFIRVLSIHKDKALRESGGFIAAIRFFNITAVYAVHEHILNTFLGPLGQLFSGVGIHCEPGGSTKEHHLKHHGQSLPDAMDDGLAAVFMDKPLHFLQKRLRKCVGAVPTGREGRKHGIGPVGQQPAGRRTGRAEIVGQLSRGLRDLSLYK